MLRLFYSAAWVKGYRVPRSIPLNRGIKRPTLNTHGYIPGLGACHYLSIESLLVVVVMHG